MKRRTSNEQKIRKIDPSYDVLADVADGFETRLLEQLGGVRIGHVDHKAI